MTDSVGGANGTVVGTTVAFANGMATIVDNNGWISLPGHLFDTNLEVTLKLVRRSQHLRQRRSYGRFRNFNSIRSAGRRSNGVCDCPNS